MGYILGVDIGGTFTDFTLVDEAGCIRVWKELSTRADPAQAVREGIESLSRELGLELKEFLRQTDLFVHGSTIATNCVIQRSGPTVGLICTKGFRDILYFRDGFKWERYNVHLPHPEDFIPRHLRLPVEERIDYRGEVLTPLNEADVRAAAERLRREGVGSVAVCLLWSIANPAHERRVQEILREELPGAEVVISTDILPMIREWERTCATVLSAYVLPGIARYLVDLEEYLQAQGYRYNLLAMQINGGSSTVGEILKRPVYALASGPAAAPAAGLFYAQAEEAKDLITVDMGGTSFDVCLARGGSPTMTRELRIEHMPLGIAAIDVHSIGAGGGSIAWVDRGGALQVGPQSAGAEPGPACYGRGGEEPTVTDANLVLGYLNPDYFLGGRRGLRQEPAEGAIRRRVAGPLRIGLVEAAHGIFRVVNHNMVNGIRAVSIERGIDPREFTLVAAGGAGPAHAGRLTAELGIRKMIVPRDAGTFCALGMVVADVRHDYLESFATPSTDADLDQINRLYRDLEARARQDLAREGIESGKVSCRRFVDAKYPNQVHEITVPVPFEGELGRGEIRQIVEAFHDLHEQLYTYCVRESSVDFYHWRMTATGSIPQVRPPEQPRVHPNATPALKGHRSAYFPERAGFTPTPVYDADRLRHGMAFEGPAIVEGATTTLVVFPGQELTVDRYGNYAVTIEVAG